MYVLSKDWVQCAGDVVFMIVDGLFPQRDLHIRVTLKTTSFLLTHVIFHLLGIIYTLLGTNPFLNH